MNDGDNYHDIHLPFSSIAVQSFIIISFSSLIYFMGDYYTLFKVTKVLSVGCMTPIVHRSMIFDFLKSQQPYPLDSEEPQYPDYFNLFLEDAYELNQPELQNDDTVLHCAFKEGQFDALVKMIRRGGNPFVRNKEGKSVESMLDILTADQGPMLYIFLWPQVTNNCNKLEYLYLASPSGLTKCLQVRLEPIPVKHLSDALL